MKSRFPNDQQVYVVVAHPDDEMLIFGGIILQFCLPKMTTIVCVTDGGGMNGSHCKNCAAMRKREFIDLCTSLSVKYVWLGLIDNGSNSHLNTYGVYSGIKKIFNPINQFILITHSLKGDYGHLHHMTVALACQSLKHGTTYFLCENEEKHQFEVTIKPEVVALQKLLFQTYYQSQKDERLTSLIKSNIRFVYNIAK